MSVNVLDLNHQELCELTTSTLSRILSTDPLMSDLPGDIHLEEIQAQVKCFKLILFNNKITLIDF